MGEYQGNRRKRRPKAVGKTTLGYKFYQLAWTLITVGFLCAIALFFYAIYSSGGF